MKHIRLIILGGIFILVIIVLGILFVQIQALEAPDITVTFQPTTFTPNNVTVQTTVLIKNPNSFDIIIGDIIIDVTTQDHTPYFTLILNGDIIAPQQDITLSSKDILSFQGAIPETLNCTITGILGVRLMAMFEKTLPYTIHLVVPLQIILDEITAPDITLTTKLTTLTEQGISLNGTIQIKNPNSYKLTLQNMTLLCTTENGEQVGEFAIRHNNVAGQETTVLTYYGSIYFTSLNAETLTLSFSGTATAQIAGITQSLPLSAQAFLAVPDIREILLINESLEFSLSGQFKPRLRGLVVIIGFTIKNPSNIPLEVRDLVCSIEVITGDTTHILGQQTMESCVITPHNEICRTTQILIPYRKFFTLHTGRLLGDWYQISIQGNFSIKDVQQTIPISLRGYLSPHFFI